MKLGLIMKRLFKFWSVFIWCMAILVFYPANIFSQNELVTETKPDKIIKFDIVGLMGDGVTNSSGIQLGVEMELKKSFSFEQDLMYIFKFDSDNPPFFETEVENILGLKSVSEFRYYFKKDIDPKLTDVYIAPGLILQYTTASRKQSDKLQNTNNYIVNRFVFAFHGKLGIQFELYKNLLLDISAGLGIRYVSSNSSGEKDGYIYGPEYVYGKKYNSGSQWQFPSMTGSFRIGYRF